MNNGFAPTSVIRKMYPNIYIIFCIFMAVIGNACKMSSTERKENTGLHRGGIVFLRTCQPETIREFYTRKVGCELWLDQGGCFILQHGNLLLGFCQSDEADTAGVYTFFYTEREEVDKMYNSLQEIADGPPRDNPRYRIYHFYARDPEGRSIEFQWFNHDLPPF